MINEDMNFIIAQIIGLIALCVLGLSFQKNDKKVLLKYQIISSFLYALQYVFLSAWTGSLMNLMCMIRNIVYSKFENKRVPLWIVGIVIVCMIGLSMFSYTGIISLLPMIAVVIYTISLSQSSLKIVRLVEIISCTLFIIYNINVLAYTGLIATVIELIMALIGIIRFDIKNTKKGNSNF